MLQKYVVVSMSEMCEYFPKNFYGGVVVENTCSLCTEKWGEATRLQQQEYEKKPFKLTKTSLDKKNGD